MHMLTQRHKTEPANALLGSLSHIYLKLSLAVACPKLPRGRFGKTISVSMFAAAMLYAAPNVECSIYSTCKRISQKLLRNVCQFLDLIYEALGVPKYKVLRANMEELVVKGPESGQDRRVVNSYPSKVIYSGFAEIALDRHDWRASRLSVHMQTLVNMVSKARYVVQWPMSLNFSFHPVTLTLDAA